MRLIGLCTSIMLLSACGNPDSVKVGLSTRVGAARGAQSAPGHIEQRLEAPTGITIDRVRLSVRELELELEGDDADDGHTGGADDGTRDDDDSEQEVGPLLIDLTSEDLNGQVIRVGNLEVEPGIFDEIEFDIGKVSTTEAGEDAALQELARLGASVVIDGHIDGQPFSFVSSVRLEQEREARFEVKAGEEPNITINIDPSGWFVDGQGQRLDPRDDAARSTIENNLRRSIDAFDDDDEDGDEDDDHDDDNDD
ncbi:MULTISPECIES: hypothetical protein [Myxococcus]|uniref:Lipoprotein n=1 Tax=Myxococcus llanfairpwllgwyngyllgogerychwyrndrobwllllantysiliogogogochensis TaxID=2590453 RepID=A0A540X8G7_9BACT|nr:MULTISPECIES: hypothetical protein [Myxococcus]NTX00509.1 hypothetical protein [Myxococcus sp. CA040A]TQF17591.1 hypothetical protein FJV41_02010 [Myxococcus llanfairpwllgwyngyllgogerychwyrndrobwllllantysiliogogogochensis]